MAAKTRSDLEALDRSDPLAAFREEFFLPEGVIYLNGNSLGAMPLAAAKRAKRVIEHEWAEGLIGSMNSAGWYELPSRLGAKIAPLVGAKPSECVLTDATGINLYKIVAAALQIQPDRRVIVMEGSNFPTNNYTVQGLIDSLGKGHSIRFAEKDELMDAIDKDVAAICITQVHYKTGHIHGMAAMTEKAHSVGAAAVWDLCHSIGAIPVDLNGCNVDFAVACTYKYVSCGPGAPALIFLPERHHGKYLQPLTGWYSHDDPFAFERDYRPAAGVRQMLSGTQPTASLSMAECGIDILLRADIHQIREKSMRMTDLFIDLVESRCGDFGFELVSPRDAASRGSQVSFHKQGGYPIIRALHDRGVVCDYRAPGNMRFGFAPLYIRYVDVWDAVARLHDVLSSEAWKEARYQKRAAVT